MASVKQIIGVLVICAVIIAGMAWWMESVSTTTPPILSDETEINLDEVFDAEDLEVYNEEITNPMNPIAVLQTNKGVIELELFEDVMPITVGNFITLAEDSFYDDQKFHRVIDGFMIQGGDPNSKGDDVAAYGTGGPGYTIQDEFVEDDRLTNVRGTIAMANTGQPDSGGSQFFINSTDNIQLDYNNDLAPQSRHPVFGKVISGLDVVDAISAVETNERDLPLEPIVIQSVTIQRGS